MVYIVDLDLVIPAVIMSELDNMRRLKDYKKYSNVYLDGMLISVEQVMAYAHRLQFRTLGRVVIRFNADDVNRYFILHPDIFKKTEGADNLYSVLVPKDGEKHKESSIRNLLRRMISTINYSPCVLKTTGLVEL